MYSSKIVSFIHDITFPAGEMTILSSSAKLAQLYEKYQIPTFGTDHTGRILEPGIYIDSLLNRKYAPYSYLIQQYRTFSHQCHLKNGQKLLHYFSREHDCQHLYTLSFDLSEDDFTHFVINNGAFVQNFIDEYRCSAYDLILEAKEKMNRITLPTMPDFDKRFFAHQVSDVCVVHKTSQLPIHLSPQRGQCFRYLIQGKTCKEIAKLMNRSPKTIEHYIAYLRKTLDCRSSKELISYYADTI